MVMDHFSWIDGMEVLDRSAAKAGSEDIRYPFALDELLARRVGEGGAPACHLWRHPRAFVMGSKDARLPGAAEAVRELAEDGYRTLVRHSGGAAVPLDDGVLNVSLIMPIDGKPAAGFHGDFVRMYALIRHALLPYGGVIGRGEVAGSYCPGEYDLHVGGLKFCGIAQRRQVRAMIVQAFVNAEGPGAERAELVRDFYARAGAGAARGDFPVVVPWTMTSLGDSGLATLGGALGLAEAIVRGVRGIQAERGTAASAALVLPEPAEIAEACERLSRRYPLPE